MNKGLIYKLTSPFNNQIFFSICKFRLHMIIIMNLVKLVMKVAIVLLLIQKSFKNYLQKLISYVSGEY